MEFALVVHQDSARRGLGKVLLQMLVERARDRGIDCVWGQVLAENRAMIGLARSLGFRVRADPQEPTCCRVEWRAEAAPATG